MGARVCTFRVFVRVRLGEENLSQYLGESNPGRALYSPGSVRIVAISDNGRLVVCFCSRVTFYIKNYYGELIDDSS